MNRIRKKEEITTLFHYVRHKNAVQSINECVGTDHQIIVAGAWPAPGITECIYWILQRNPNNDDDDDEHEQPTKDKSTTTRACYETQVHRWPSYNCDNPSVDDKVITTTAMTTIIRDVINNKNTNSSSSNYQNQKLNLLKELIARKQIRMWQEQQQKVPTKFLRRLVARPTKWNATYESTDLEEGLIIIGVIEYRFVWRDTIQPTKNVLTKR